MMAITLLNKINKNVNDVDTSSDLDLQRLKKEET